ncbi:hypothetical protein [Kribbella shirazensis]|uniref:Uncharacterized protein n=1 Tax=Kribbella shirazensis TaxID=1105143 RepID=A0A7X5ZY47_9ACTN|nr:hypothetical protein [Kribbella shirazensis]NIK54681.1 hypothetical protein [Kribbella shirazensis]
MTDLRELLRAAAAEGSDAVDLAEDVVVGRIRHRRIRNRRLAVGGVALASAAVIAGTAWAVRPGPDQPPTAGGPSDVPPRIVRSDSEMPGGMEAGLKAMLTVDASGCVRAGSGGSATTLVWPRGYSVRGNSESFEILDGANEVVARSGVLLDIAGGGVGSKDTWTGQDCVGNGPLFLVSYLQPAR